MGEAVLEKRVSGLSAWKVILAMIRFRPWYWLVDLLSVTAVRVAFQLGPGLLLREFFNLITGEGPARLGIWTVVALFASLYLGRVLGTYGFFYADVPLFSDVATLLRKNLLRHILRRPGAQPLPDSPGEAVSRFRNDVMEIPLFAIWINDILIGLAIIVVSIAILSSINLWITLLALVPLGIMGVIANAASSRIEAYRRASRQATGQVTGFIGEMFGAVQAVKVAAAERSVTTHFNALNDERRWLTLRERLFDGVLESIWHNIGSLGTGVILLLAGQAMRAGTFTVGDFSLFVYLLQSIGDLTTFGGMIAARYKQLSVSVERMVRLMEGAGPAALVEITRVNLDQPDSWGAEEQVIGAGEQGTQGLREEELRLKPGFLLEARGLTYHYPGTGNGIEGVDLRLEPGTLTVVTGRVGSGKTTLLRALLGLLPLESGEIYWNGVWVEEPGSFFTPPRSAYTAQVPRLFSQTLRNNILLGLEKEDAELREALRQAVMEHDLEAMEDGLDTRVGTRGVKLSGGQAQRTAAARMFIRKPELLVFDDLSSALDVDTEKIMWERLQAATILAVSHRRAVLRKADHIIVLKLGRVEADGRLEDLLESCQEMRELWSGGTA